MYRHLENELHPTKRPLRPFLSTNSEPHFEQLPCYSPDKDIILVFDLVKKRNRGSS